MIEGIPCPHGKDLIQQDIYRSKVCRKCDHFHENYEAQHRWCNLGDCSNIAALAEAEKVVEEGGQSGI